MMGKASQTFIFSSIFKYFNENNLYVKTSLDSDLLTHVSINFFPLSMTYMHLLVLTHHMILLDISKA